MKKLKLGVEDLTVESWETSGKFAAGGTVRGAGGTSLFYSDCCKSGDFGSCAPVETCWESCGPVDCPSEDLTWCKKCPR